MIWKESDTGLPMVRSYMTQRSKLAYGLVFHKDSARLWCSNNPWKKSCYMKVASSSLTEYIAAVEGVKATQPPIVPRTKRGRYEKAHDQLLVALNKRVTIIEEEERRVEAMFAKLDRKAAAEARAAELAESRQVRTRLRTRMAGGTSDSGSNAMSGEANAPVCLIVSLL